jgi:predicted small integral membrane protein
MSKTIITRWLAAALVFGVALNELFHAIFDGLNFSGNAEIVGVVLSMSATIEPDSWRAIDNTLIAHFAYGLIWIAHAGSGVFSAVGSYFILLQGHSQAGLEKGHLYSFVGLGMGAILYLIGFVSIASGWFILHTAPTPPNFVINAQMLFLIHMTVIFYLMLYRDEGQS